MFLCPREKLTHVRGDATMRSTLERFLPSCPVIGFGRPYLVVVVHGAIIVCGCVLGVDGGRSCQGICSVASVSRGMF